jgi:hypothetical protein
MPSTKRKPPTAISSSRRELRRELREVAKLVATATPGVIYARVKYLHELAIRVEIQDPPPRRWSGKDFNKRAEQ